MNFSAAILSTLIPPAARIASDSVKLAIETGASFAEQLKASTSGVELPETSQVATAAPTRQLNQLLQELQQFLATLSVDEADSIELQSDGGNSLKVSGPVSISEAVESWLSQNPEWAEAWQTAVKRYLESGPALADRGGGLGFRHTGPQQLRSRVAIGDSEHWVTTPSS